MLTVGTGYPSCHKAAGARCCGEHGTQEFTECSRQPWGRNALPRRTILSSQLGNQGSREVTHSPKASHQLDVD